MPDMATSKTGLILDLLLRGEFPRVHRPPFESREVLRLLRYPRRLRPDGVQKVSNRITQRAGHKLMKHLVRVVKL